KRPRDVELRKETARVLAAAGKMKEANEQLLAATKVAPEDVSVLEEIIRFKISQAEKSETETGRQQLFAELPSVYARLREINNENLDYIVREGEAWWKAGDEQKALEIWNGIISEEEIEIRRYELFGDTLLRQKRYDDAIAAFHKGIELDTARDDLRMQIGEVLLQQNKVEEAQKEFQAIIERGTATEITYLRIASLYEEINLQDRVLATMKEAAKVFPNSYDVQLRLGSLYLDAAPSMDNPEAREALWNAFLTGPTPRARLVANLKLMKTYSNREELKARMQKHIAENPSDLTALMALGDIATGYEGSAAGRKVEITGGGNVGQGQLAYKAVQARDPLYLAAYEHNASLLIAADRFEDAVLEYRKMVVVNPVNKWAYWLRIGDLFADQGQMREAGVYWDFIQERNISDPQILYQLGARMLRAERYADALKLIEIAARIHPNDYRLQLSLGHLYEHFHNYEKSVRAYTRSIQLATSDLVLPVRIHLGRIQRLYGEQLWSLGRTHEALEIFQSSQAFLEKLKEITGETPPEYPNVMVQVARCLEALDRKAEAAKAYQAAAEGFPKTWVWVNSRTEMWLPFFEQLRSKDKHHFRRKEPELHEQVSNKVTAKLVADVWPVSQIIAAHAEPSKIHLVGMDSQITLNTSDLTWKRQPLPLKYEQRLKTSLFPPFLMFLPLGKAGANELWNPSYNKLYDSSTGAHDIYALDSLKKVASIPFSKDLSAWPAQSGNRIYFQSENAVYGYDLSTGKALWEQKDAYKSGNIRILSSSPRYLSVTESTDEVVRFQVLDATTGRTIVIIDPGTFHFWRTPLILGDTFFSYDDFDGMLVAWKLPDGRPLYRARFGGQLAAELQSPDGKTLLIHSRKLKERKIILSSIDAANGQVRWQTHLKLESIDRGPVIADNHILYVYRYRPEKVDEPAYDKPGPFYKANRGILVVDRTTGELLSDIDLTTLMSERSIQDIREAFYDNLHLFLITHDAKTFKLKLSEE
ncbi:MAG: tetratricopeptide repeat protein, partial [Planctomycetota bacterium]|nr:tetratricopeptide repeat protein [Planctomycetota bacterium]